MSETPAPPPNVPVFLELPEGLTVNHDAPAAWYMTWGNHGRAVLWVRTREGMLSVALDAESCRLLAGTAASFALLLEKRAAQE